MANAIPIQIAQAVTDAINAAATAGTFTIGAFTAKRSYADWDETYSDLDGMQVDVVYTSHQQTSRHSHIELETESTLVYRPPIDIAIRKRFEPEHRDPATNRLLNAPVDELVTLLEEIHELFVSRRIADVFPETDLDAAWDETQVMSWVNQKMLRTGLFEGVIRVTFETNKDI